MSVALIVAPSEDDREDYAAALRDAGLRSILCDSQFEAMGMVGRAEITSVVFPVTRRVLAAKGLCQLAEREHPGVKLIAVRTADVPLQTVQGAFPDPSVVIVDGGGHESVVAEVIAALPRQAPEKEQTDRTELVSASIAAGIEVPSTDSGPSVFANSEDEDDTIPHVLTEVMPQLAATQKAALMTGDLSSTPGIELLMTLCVRKLTGRLEIEDVATLYFVGGDPVWAVHRESPTAWLKELRRTGLVPAGVKVNADDESTLLDALEARELMSSRDAEEAARELLATSVERTLDAGSGAFSFTETMGPPRSAQNTMGVFEVLLVRCRRSFDMNEIRRRAKRFEGRPLFPTSALASMSPRLRPFVEGRELAELIDGRRACRELWRDIGLSPSAGALLVITLVAAHLATFDGSPAETTGRVELTALIQRLDTDSDSSPRVI
jgi:hypothetical protein